jgi:hypothetical protein
MINRRESLGLVAGAAVASVAGAGDEPAINPSDHSWTGSQQGLLRALMKLRASLDDRVTLEWFRGVVYGVVDSAMTPLFTVNAVAFAYYQQTQAGVFRGRRVEVTYHGDLQRDQLIEDFENPYTGQTVEVPTSRTPLQDAVIGPDGLVPPERIGRMRVEADTRLGPGLVNGDRGWVRLDTRSTLFIDGVESPVSEYGESMSYAGASRDIADPAVLSAPCQISYTNVMSWRPWLGMDGRSGHTITVASGEKVESLAAVPRELAEFVRSRHPDLAEDARAVLSTSMPEPG